MSKIENLNNNEGVLKLKQMVENINVCFFCTDIKNNNTDTTTLMTAQNVDEEGNIWFFSGKDSDRNKAISQEKEVQLYFSHPGKNNYLIVNSEASIVLDKEKIKELWNPILKIWFKDGIDDPNISLLKVATKSAHYWDSEGGKMVNFIKMISSLISGTNNVDTTEGKIKI